MWAAFPIPGVVNPIIKFSITTGTIWFIKELPIYPLYLTPKYNIEPRRPNIAPEAPAATVFAEDNATVNNDPIIALKK